jgi:hypothetical protein
MLLRRRVLRKCGSQGGGGGGVEPSHLEEIPVIWSCHRLSRNDLSRNNYINDDPVGIDLFSSFWYRKCQLLSAVLFSRDPRLMHTGQITY